jgi:hypothetical protein
MEGLMVLCPQFITNSEHTAVKIQQFCENCDWMTGIVSIEIA